MGTLFSNVRWSTESPAIYLSCDYIIGARTATTVQVRLVLTVSGLQYSDSYFGYTIEAHSKVNDAYQEDWWTIKNSSPSQWFSDLTTNFPSASGWYTVPAAANLTSLPAGFDMYSNADSSYNHYVGGTIEFPVGNTAPYFPSGATAVLNYSGTIPENVSTVRASTSGAVDNEGNTITYSFDFYVNGVFSNSVVTPNKYADFNFASLAQGQTLMAKIYCKDDATGWSSPLSTNTITKNTFTKATLSTSAGIGFSTEAITLARTGATNSNGNTSFTYNLSGSVTVYNGSWPSGSTSLQLSIYRSGTVPTTPYIKFSDLKAALAGSNYAGAITLTLTSYNAYGSSGSQSLSVSVNLQQIPTVFTVNAPTGTFDIPTTAGAATPTTPYYVINRKALTLSWTASTDPLNAGAITYLVEVSINSGSWEPIAYGVSGLTTTYPMQSISSRQTFKYRVTAKTVYGTSLAVTVSDAINLDYYNPPYLDSVKIDRGESSYTIQFKVNASSSIYGTLLQDVFTLTRADTSTVVDTFTRSAYGTNSYTTALQTITGLTETLSYTLQVAYTDQVCSAFGLSPATLAYVIPRYSAMLTVRENGVGIDTVCTNKNVFGFAAKVNALLDIPQSFVVVGPSGTCVQMVSGPVGLYTNGDWYAKEAISGTASVTITKAMTALSGSVGLCSTNYLIQGTFAVGQVIPANARTEMATCYPVSQDASGNVTLGGNLYDKNQNLVMGLKADSSGYWGVTLPSTGQQGWIRTPTNGLLPNVSGGSGYVGTAAYPFNYGYFNSITGKGDHDLVSHGNEFNVIPSGYNNSVWLNYRDHSGNLTGTVSAYAMGNGHGGYAGVTANSFYSTKAGAACSCVKYVDVTTILTIASTSGTTYNFTPSGPTANNWIGTVLKKAWPRETWANGAICTLAYAAEYNSVVFTTNSPQSYEIVLRIFYDASK